jgi:ComF family protein
MFDKILQIIAPHHCYSCQNKGAVLCDSCVYNIANESENQCIECRKPSQVGICNTCQAPFSKAWITGVREDELARIIGDFKWARVYQAYSSLGELLLSSIPTLPDNTVVVPIPTIAHHKRIRGYDHAYLLAKYFADQRKLKLQTVLKRNDNSIQHTANKKQRQRQAEKAFSSTTQLRSDVPYLIIDDIVTTGSTIKAATRVLKGAGANEVWVAAIARQPLN